MLRSEHHVTDACSRQFLILIKRMPESEKRIDTCQNKKEDTSQVLIPASKKSPIRGPYEIVGLLPILNLCTQKFKNSEPNKCDFLILSFDLDGRRMKNRASPRDRRHCTQIIFILIINSSVIKREFLLFS